MPVSLRARPGAYPLGLIYLGAALALALGVGLFHLDRGPVSFCAFKAVTGLPCLTCGTTRALARFFALDFRAALAMNPLVSSLVLLLVPWGLADLVLLPRGRAVVMQVSSRSAGRIL